MNALPMNPIRRLALATLCLLLGTPSMAAENSIQSEERGGGTPGVIRDAEGQVLGEHSGIEGFTVGQRRGLGLGGGPPRYVLRIVPDERAVVVGSDDDLLRGSLDARGATWMGAAPTGPFDADVRIRYRHEGAPATVFPVEGGFRVEFREPQRAITPGQATVVYDGDEVRGGGFIA